MHIYIIPVVFPILRICLLIFLFLRKHFFLIFYKFFHCVTVFAQYPQYNLVFILATGKKTGLYTGTLPT